MGDRNVHLEEETGRYAGLDGEVLYHEIAWWKSGSKEHEREMLTEGGEKGLTG